MGWTVSHGAGCHSYASNEAFGRELSKVTTGQQWNTVAVLFDRRNGEPFPVTPADAAAMADVFEDVDPLVPEDWRPWCQRLAAAARRAHAARETWRWG
ncbi:hypothetical protein GXW82_44415 [Streptacidiphilus sp. 4-A2]|nr:hypothetical protein [Streptacidiphilus sp. 4-A2]